MKYYDDYYKEEEEMKEKNTSSSLEFGCQFCWDSRVKKEKELSFFDHANNLRICKYCPWCGRKYMT